MEMIHEAEAYARRMGHRVSVVVVDGSGIPIAMSRMDGATPWSTELALNKAYTATLYGINTDTSRLAHRSLTVMSRGKIMAGAGGLRDPRGVGLDRGVRRRDHRRDRRGRRRHQRRTTSAPGPA